ncbi:MAG: bifunctional ornithine acetyltransferase/N-acetylglutamate synthase [Ruminococcaceae bacterium]|nr:bifunctional ornithine acetyltransferase/N-acetylglutamate synthase [Oscillospiraceae bacterium]
MNITENFKFVGGGVCAAKGFKAAGIHCGIRKNRDKYDLAMIAAEKECAAAAVYTQNKVKGAPIAVTRDNIANGYARAVICNSGNANTCNGDGVEKARMMCDIAAEALGISTNDIIVASTGVIGQTLPIEPIAQHTKALAAKLSENGSSDANLAIMTTDTRQKEVAVEFELDGKLCHVGGIAKGSGMIHPNMATMLGFLTTDVSIAPAALQKALSSCIADTFNMVSVDGDTSTNDMVCILANGEAGNDMIDGDGKNAEIFTQALFTVCRYIARELARDGEGATRLIECTVKGAGTVMDAKIAAKSVITSSLFKAAVFGADANWGRVLCAIGYSGAEFDPLKVDVDMSSRKGTIAVCRAGYGVEFSEEEAKVVLSEDEIFVNLDLHCGDCEATAFGCDLTYDYVKINGDYRT